MRRSSSGERRPRMLSGLPVALPATSFARMASRKRVDCPVSASCRDLQASGLCSPDLRSRDIILGNTCSCNSTRSPKNDFESSAIQQIDGSSAACKVRPRIGKFGRRDRATIRRFPRINQSAMSSKLPPKATYTTRKQCHLRLPSFRARQVLAISRACLSPQRFLVMMS